jgi:transcriptional regulator with GAF, ATPase, and Fis domain
MRVNEVLHLVLDTLHRALAFRCVVFCLREGATGRLQGRVGLGPGSTEISAAFRVDPNAAAVGDLFAVLCAKGADLLVADSASMANRLPAWYRQQVNAATFLLLPVRVKDVAVGLIYADKAEPRSIVLAEDELKLIRALRDLVAAAFGKAG